MPTIIAIPSVGQFVNVHFGRAHTFEIIKVLDGQVLEEKVIYTTGVEHHREELVRLLKNQRVETVICGGIGGPALAGLESAGLKVLRGVSGRVKDVAQAFADGMLESVEVSCEHYQENAGRRVNCFCI